MTKKEILEFLELPDSVSEQDIIYRLRDKLIYFKRLQENAPNDFLRKLHLRNIEKVKTIQEQYGDNKEEAVHVPRGPAVNSLEPLGWLIRHTENQSVKKFPLFGGENWIGRDPLIERKGIFVENDDYVSRRHAVIYVESNGADIFFIEDSAGSNNGRPSKNGTYINGSDERIYKKTQIEDKDTIQIGLTKFILKLNKNDITTIISEVEESNYMKTVVINIF